MKIQIQYREDSAADYHRVTSPFRYLQLEDGEETSWIVKNQQCKKGDFKGVDLVVFNRTSTIEFGAFKELKKEYGFKVWCDVDDYWELYADHYMYDTWKKTQMTKRILDSITMADIVTTTNKRLLAEIVKYNPHCKIIPNALPFGHEQYAPDRTESEKIRFCYTGGPSHCKDLKSIKGFFDATVSNMFLLKKASFVMAGWDKLGANEELDKMYYTMCICPNFQTRKGLSLHRYMEHYNNAEVSMCPLENNKFNTFKSNLKIIEAGAMGLPVIASNMYPYLEDVEMENTGVLFCNTTKDWMQAVRMFTDNPGMVELFGGRLYDYVRKKYDLTKVNSLRRQLINNFKMEKYGNKNY